jgi:hypothetical protein
VETLTLILTAGWPKKGLFKRTEINPEGLMEKMFVFLMSRKISLQTLLFNGSSIKKRNFQCTFDDNVCVIHVFDKQISWAAEKAPPPLRNAVCGGRG